MAKRVRVTALTHTAKGRPLAPGDELSLPEPEADRLINQGTAVLLPARRTKEKADASTGK